MSLSVTYAVYLAISLAVTIFVARTLHQRGRIFLVDASRGNAELADSINDLLVVGFYLINFGYVTLALKYGAKPDSLSESIEFLATKVGLVLVILGGMHFFNLFVISKMRSRSQRPPIRNAHPVSAGSEGEVNYGALASTIRRAHNA